MKDLVNPKSSPPPFDNPDLREVAERIVSARKSGKPVIWMMGAHVIKCGLSLLVINLMKRGVITHVASNGAVAIHDFEIALIGETSEDVATSIEAGTFGMAEETGFLMNLAVQQGVSNGLGYGRSLGKIISENDNFKFKEYSILYNAYQLGIPFTVHIALGTDIIHQHPRCDFAVLGEAAGKDFKTYTSTITKLENGVFLNFGSAVIGPEVFLKALSIARNLGFRVEKITTANFDLKSIDDYKQPKSKDDPCYYYRPLKNIVIRPTSMGGEGFHITGNHTFTIPNLHTMVIQKLNKLSITPELNKKCSTFPLLKPKNKEIIDKLMKKHSNLNPVLKELVLAYRTINLCFRTGGTLFVCGNGGSFADAFHLSAELLKSFKQRRPIPNHKRIWFKKSQQKELLTKSLEEGLRTIVLGSNHSLVSAIENDSPTSNMVFAQELYTLAKQGDVLLGLSTSGDAENILLAVETARAIGISTILLTGKSGGRIAKIADIIVQVPAIETDYVQELHVIIYHTLCEMLEVSLCERSKK